MYIRPNLGPGAYLYCHISSHWLTRGPGVVMRNPGHAIVSPLSDMPRDEALIRFIYRCNHNRGFER